MKYCQNIWFANMFFVFGLDLVYYLPLSVISTGILIYFLTLYTNLVQFKIAFEFILYILRNNCVKWLVEKYANIQPFLL